MLPIQINTAHNDEDMSVEERLLITLKTNGFLLPETDDELDLFLESLEDVHEPIPNELKKPLEIIKRGKFKRLTNIISLNVDFQDNENLAMAARDGGEISVDILKQMEKDRQQKENESNEQMG